MMLVRRAISRARREAARLRSGGSLILVYHRVADVVQDPWGMAVPPHVFDEQLAVLRRYGPLTTVGRMMRDIAGGSLPRRSVAISFDDGYADNLASAMPLLSRHDAPATFFLSPGLLDGATPFWWDELAALLLHSRPLPERLEITLGGEQVLLDLGADGDTPSRQNIGWRAWEPPPSRREAVFLRLWSMLRLLPEAPRRDTLDRLSDWAGGRAKPAAADRPLSREEAARLAGEDLIEIGCHTMTHPSLPAHNPDAQRDEIARSKAACEDIAGSAVESFSYPYGDHTTQTAALVREAGLSSACTTSAAFVRLGGDPFRVPRVQVLDWAGDEFERRLATADLF